MSHGRPRPQEPDGDAIAFAERLLALLDDAAVATTYKYALLVALIDLCLEQTSATGARPPPAMG